MRRIFLDIIWSHRRHGTIWDKYDNLVLSWQHLLLASGMFQAGLLVARTNTLLFHSVISNSHILLTSIGQPNACFDWKLPPPGSRQRCFLIKIYGNLAGDVASIFRILCKLNKPEDVGSKLLRNAYMFLPDHTASHPRTQSSQSPSWGSETSHVLLALRPEVGLDDSKKRESNPCPLPGIKLPFLCLCVCCAISQTMDAFLSSDFYNSFNVLPNPWLSVSEDESINQDENERSRVGGGTGAVDGGSSLEGNV
jgi:hypothetical protein